MGKGSAKKMTRSPTKNRPMWRGGRGCPKINMCYIGGGGGWVGLILRDIPFDIQGVPENMQGVLK